MDIKEKLQYFSKSTNLEELYTRVNGHAYVYIVDQGGYYENSNDYKFMRQVINNTTSSVRSRTTALNQEERDVLPKMITVNFETYAEYQNGHTLRDSGLIKLPYLIEKPVLYFAEDGKLYATKLSFNIRNGVKPAKVAHRYADYYDNYYLRSDAILTFAPWKVVDRIVEVDCHCLQPYNTIMEWFEKKNKYACKWWKEDLSRRNFATGQHGWYRRFKFDIPFIVTHEELELLDKMVINQNRGLALIPYMINAWGATKSDRQAFNRMFKPGKNAAEIFVLPMNFVKVLWNKPMISQWDTIRKMVNLRDCSIDDIIQCEERHIRTDQYNKIDEILRAKINDKPVFSFSTLINYLQKIDVNEAIEMDEGLMLIADTIAMCRQANLEPNFNTDSLKRTHDVTMRNARIVRNEQTARQIKERCTNKYKFEYGSFFVRQIESYDDLMDEGQQQENCLRYCYASRIADGSSLIYVMRRKDEPTRSLISIELDPTGERVRQSLLSHNRSITSDAHLKFLDKWAEYRKQINDKEEL